MLLKIMFKIKTLVHLFKMEISNLNKPLLTYFKRIVIRNKKLKYKLKKWLQKGK